MIFLFSLAFGAGPPMDAAAVVRQAQLASPERAHLVARLEALEPGRSMPDELEFRPSVRNLRAVNESVQTTLRLRQKLAAPGSLRALRNQRQAALSVEQIELNLYELELRARVLDAYDRARFSREELVLVGREISLAQQRVDVVRLRLEAGLQVGKQVLDAVLEHASAVQRQARVQLEQSAALRQLSKLTGEEVLLVEQDLLAEVREALPSAPSPAKTPSAEVLHAEASLRLRRAERVPFLNWVQGEMKLEEGVRTTYGVSASVSIPFWRYLDGEVAQARDRVVRERSLAEHQRSGWLEGAREQEEIFAESLEALRAAEGALDVSRTVVEEFRGEVSPGDLLQAEVALVGQERKFLGMVQAALKVRRKAESAWLSVW